MSGKRLINRDRSACIQLLTDSWLVRLFTLSYSFGRPPCVSNISPATDSKIDLEFRMCIKYYDII